MSPDPSTVTADDGYKWKAFSAIAISLVTIVMSMSMVFVALSAIASEYGVTLRAVSWVVIVQSLTITALMLPMGRLADIVGRRRVHLLGLTLFATGAICCAVAPSFALLLVARVVMAVGNSMAQAVSSAIVVSVFPASERGTAVGSQTTAVAIGAALGPIVAGLLLQVISWRALFVLIALPVVVAYVVGYVVLDEARVTPDRDGRPTRFDWTGAVICALAVSAVILTVSNPLAHDWLSVPILAGTLAALALLGAFVWWELRVPVPVLELRLFRNAVLATALGVRLVGFTAGTVGQLLLPVFLIAFRGMSTAGAGVVMFLSAVGLGLASQTCGRLGDRFGERRFVILGFATVVMTSYGMSRLDGSTPLTVVALVALVNGMGLGAWSVPNNSMVMGSVPRAVLGVAGALTNLTRNVGNVLGQAIAAAVVTAAMVARGFDIAPDEISDTPGAGAAFLTGWRYAFVVSIALALGGLILTVVVRPRRRFAWAGHDEEAVASLRPSPAER